MATHFACSDWACGAGGKLRLGRAHSSFVVAIRPLVGYAPLMRPTPAKPPGQMSKAELRRFVLDLTRHELARAHGVDISQIELALPNGPQDLIYRIQPKHETN
jgi:hypothetical protein